MRASSKLADSWAKLDWAKGHFDKLTENFLTWQRNNQGRPPFTVKVPYEQHKKAFVVRVDTIAPIEQEWSLRVGDALVNYRASLDYLAQVLVASGSCPRPARPRDVGFPYERRAREWEKTVGKRLPGIRRKHRTVVEKFQPYQSARSGEDPALHPLALLSELSNADKHNRITLLYARHSRYEITPHVVGFDIKRMQTPPINRAMLVRPGAELGRLVGGITATKAQVKVDISGATILAFESGANVRATLDKIGKAISFLLSEIEPQL